MNKQRVLIFSSRGISHRDRHLMLDLKKMMPHSKSGKLHLAYIHIVFKTMKNLYNATLTPLRDLINSRCLPDMISYFIINLADLKMSMSRVMRKLTIWFPIWSDTNQAVQLQEMARGLKFWI